jgi:branched-chain amino acid aminotransferase
MAQTIQPAQKNTNAASTPIIPSVATDQGWAYFQGAIVPMQEATVNIATHALNYGTGCFEGIRAYWNEKQEQLYVLKLREHFERFAFSRRTLKLKAPETVDDLCNQTVELLRRQNFRENVYIRPLAFKGARSIKLGLSKLEGDTVAIYANPMGNYVDIDAGLRVCVSSWRRVSNNALPARAKTTGGYVNSALAVDDAVAAGYDEAIFLTDTGRVSEGSSCNLFLIKRGKLHTPRVADDILEGITRAAIMQMADSDLGIATVERAIDRVELYDADEVFFVGTGVQISPVTEIDGRKIGAGTPGAITMDLQQRYLRAARGDDPAYADWVTPVYPK